MSVIVFRAGIVAADTRVSNAGYVMPERCQKIWSTPWGVAGFVGTYTFVDVAREWTCTADDGTAVPEWTKDTTVIEFREDGIFVSEEGHTYRQPAPLGYFAWGSGTPVALGALYAGADARRAVEIACLVEPQCGGDVVVLHLDGGT